MYTNDYVFVISVCNFIFLKNVSTVNVALGARTKYCGIQDLQGKLVDGDIRKDMYEELTTACDEGNAFIEIITDKIYYIHYFVVYKGLAYDIGQLSHFRAEIFVTNEFILCAEYNLPIVFDDGARVNCALRPASNKFRVKSHMNLGLTLSEIELNHLGSDGEKPLLLYRGCYKRFNGTRSANTDIIGCSRSCNGSDYHFAMKKGGECYCGYGYDDAQAAGDICDMTCDESGLKCGGKRTYSVYIENFRLPYFKGCYEHPLLTSPKIEGNMSVGKCLKYCDGDKYAFLSNGDICQCSLDLETITERREECTTECTGISDVMCGSDVGNIYALYRTCLNREEYALECSKAMMCLNGDYDTMGVCQRGCETYYFGQHCLEKYDFPLNGDNLSDTLLLYIFLGLGGALTLAGVLSILLFKIFCERENIDTSEVLSGSSASSVK